MKRLFKLMAAGMLMASPLVKVNTNRHAFAQVQRIGSGKPDLARLTVKELRAMATAMKIKGRSKARRKAQLVALIQKASQ
ncbi:MAG: Rho termination factor N-terminal domain-containing protein [Methylacidiphilales bacterium]|nr:Rho termination factor N-terminal domain-containing protein [Candidatus Methylacidiphilales bacterium]